MEDFQHYLKLINNCDPSDPLLSRTTLGNRLSQLPLNLVTKSDLNYMTQALNSEQLIPTEAGLARDYRGLAELMGFSSIEIENCIKRSYNPTRSLIDAFIISNKDVTLNDLLKLIENIERFDVIDDIMPTLIKLASSQNHQLQVSLKQQPSLEVASPGECNEHGSFNRLTVDDGPYSTVIIYDAFICYAPEDIEYAKELIDLLESNDKSVATADDLLPGHFEHDALVRLIDNRCKKVIIILTPNFSRSKECEFQTKFASEIGIKADSPKIIPVLYEACDDSALPSMIKVLSKIDMTNQASRQWQLHRLIRSLTEEHDTQMRNTRGSFSRLMNNSDGKFNAMQLASTSTASSSPSRSCQAHTDNDCSIPAITFSNSEQIQKTDSGPVIDIMPSENSRELELRQATCSKPAQVAHPNLAPSIITSSSNPINWLKKQVTRLEWRKEPTLTSQAILIDSDYANERYQELNGDTVK